MGKKSTAKKDEPKGKATKGDGDSTKAGAGKPGGTAPGEKMSGKDYAREMKKLHVELVKLQQWVMHKGLKVCIVFEGRDGAGKGGTIKAITERVSPRVFRVDCASRADRARKVPDVCPAVSAAPAGRGRGRDLRPQLVQPRGGGAGDGVLHRGGGAALPGSCLTFEKLMVDSGIILLKYWLEVSSDEQTRRLEARIDDGRKIWKLSPMDLKSYSRWYDYSKARDEMFAATDTAWAPWFVARSDDKQRARLNIISHLLGSIPYKEAPREKVKLPPRQKAGGYREPDYPYKLVTEKY